MRQLDHKSSRDYSVVNLQHAWVMDAAEFYKNKPKNLARITSNRVWSYEITDHASGVAAGPTCRRPPARRSTQVRGVEDPIAITRP